MMNTNPAETSQIGPDGVLDVTALPCSIKHGLIIRTCLSLPVGSHCVLQNGHYPQKLLNQLEVEWPGAFAWELSGDLPEACRVRITKLKLTVETTRPLPPLVCAH